MKTYNIQRRIIGYERSKTGMITPEQFDANKFGDKP